MECPSLEQLERSAASGEDGEVAAHVRVCAGCSESFATLREHRALASELAAALGAAGPATPAIDGYTELAEIHRGGQGVVYRALQLSTKRVVAIKVLLDGAFASPKTLHRFEREVEIAAGLDHPNIVTVHDSGATADGRRYFVMEHVDGVPANETKSGDRRAQLTLFARIANAVHFAHQRGVLHRDLKPGNVLIDTRMEPHVLDFGMAVASSEQGEAGANRLTLSGEFMGTLAYASPEHVRGHPGEIDVRSDVYALGVILYEMLTGCFPYPVDGGVLEVIRSVAEREPSRAGVDDELETIVRTCLSKEKDRRYQSAGALAHDIERYLAGEPIDAKRDSTWYVLRKAIARNKLPSAAVAGTLLVIAVAAVVSAVQWRDAVTQTKRAETQAAKAEVMSGFFRDMLDAISPDQAKGRTVTVREVLDEASARLLEQRPAEPEAELELRSAIGVAYRSLELPHSAEPHLVRAAELAREVFGEESLEAGKNLYRLGAARVEMGPMPDAGQTLRRAADVLAHCEGQDATLFRVRAVKWLAYLSVLRGELDEAEARFAEVSALATTAAGDPSDELAGVISDFGLLHDKRGDPTRAEALFRQALEMRSRLPTFESTMTATQQRRLGHSLEDLGRTDEALASFRDALALRVKLLGEDHPTTLLDRVNIVHASMRLEGHGPTEIAYARVVDQYETVLGDRNLEAAESLNNLGVLALDRGDYTFAERVQREAVARYDELLDLDTFDAAVAKGNLAWTLIRRGSAVEAIALCEEALVVVRQRMGPRTAEEARSLARLSWAHIAGGDWNEALRRAEEALAIRRELLGNTHADVVASLTDVGWFHYVNAAYDEAEANLLEALGTVGEEPSSARASAEHALAHVMLDRFRAVDAEPLARAALDVRRQFLGERHPDVAESMNTLAMALYFQHGVTDEVDRLFTDALDILRDQGDDFPRTPWVMGNLGAIRRAEGDLDAAEEYVEDALVRARRTAAPTHPLFAMLLINRSSIYRLRGNEAEAEPLLVEAYDILAEVRGPEDPKSVQVLGALIAVLEALGKDERLEHYRGLLPN